MPLFHGSLRPRFFKNSSTYVFTNFCRHNRSASTQKYNTAFLGYAKSKAHFPCLNTRTTSLQLRACLYLLFVCLYTSTTYRVQVRLNDGTPFLDRNVFATGAPAYTHIHRFTFL